MNGSRTRGAWPSPTFDRSRSGPFKPRPAPGMASITEISSTTIGIGGLGIYQPSSHNSRRVAIDGRASPRASRGLIGSLRHSAEAAVTAWYRVAGDTEIQQARFRAAQSTTRGTLGLTKFGKVGNRTGWSWSGLLSEARPPSLDSGRRSRFLRRAIDALSLSTSGSGARS